MAHTACTQMPLHSMSAEDVERLIHEVSEYRPPTLSADGRSEGTYSLRTALWNTEFNPCRVWSRFGARGLQLAMQRYAQHCRATQTGAPGGHADATADIWPPLPAFQPLCEPMSGLVRLIRCRAVQHIVHFALFAFMADLSRSSAAATEVRETLTENVCLALHLLDLMVTDAEQANASLPAQPAPDPAATEGSRRVIFAHSALQSAYPADDIRANAAVLVTVVRYDVPAVRRNDDSALQCASIVSLLLCLQDQASMAAHRPYLLGLLARLARVSPAVSNQLSQHPQFHSILAVSIDNKAATVASTPDSDNSERRQQARDRQQRMLAQFAAWQRAFIEANAAEFADIAEPRASPDTETGAAASPTDVQEPSASVRSTDEFFEQLLAEECVICWQTGSATPDRHLCLMGLAQVSGVRMHRRCSLSARGGPQCAVPLESAFATYADWADALDREWNQAERCDRGTACAAWSSGLKAWRADAMGLQLRSCGHIVHEDCFHAYFSSLGIDLHEQWPDIECPLCRGHVNILLPILRSPTVDANCSDRGETADELLAASLMAATPRLPRLPITAKESVRNLLRRLYALIHDACSVRGLRPPEVAMFARTLLYWLLQDEADGNCAQSPNWRPSLNHRHLGAMRVAVRAFCVAQELLNAVRGSERSSLVSDPFDRADSAAPMAAPMVAPWAVSVCEPRNHLPSPLYRLLAALGFGQMLSRIGLRAPTPSDDEAPPCPMLSWDPTAVLVALVLLWPTALSLSVYRALAQAVSRLCVAQALLIVATNLDSSTRRFFAQEQQPAVAEDAGPVIDPVPRARHSGDWRRVCDAVQSLVEPSTTAGAVARGDAAGDAAVALTAVSTTAHPDTAALQPACLADLGALVSRLCLPTVRTVAILEAFLFGNASAVTAMLEASGSGAVSGSAGSVDGELREVRDLYRLMRWPGMDATPFARSEPEPALFGDADGCPALVPAAQLRSTVSALLTSRMPYALFCGPSVRLLLQPCLLRLPDDYADMLLHYAGVPCTTCGSVPKHPVVCLLCGRLLCMHQECCERRGVGEVSSHVSGPCGAGQGLLLSLMSTETLVVCGRSQCQFGSLYLDAYGEEDRNLRRGKPLRLCHVRYQRLQQRWISGTLRSDGALSWTAFRAVF